MEKRIPDEGEVRIQERPLKAFLGGIILFACVAMVAVRFHNAMVMVACFALGLAAGVWAVINRATLLLREESLDMMRPLSRPASYAWSHIHAVQVVHATNRTPGHVSFRYDTRLPGQLSEPQEPVVVLLHDAYPVNLDALAGAITRRRTAWIAAHPEPETDAGG